MLHHLALTASNLPKSAEFYDALLSLLGYRRTHSMPHLAVWEGPQPEILLYAAKPAQAQHHHRTYNPGFHHAAFRVDTREMVLRAGELAQRFGVHILDAPRLFPNYSPHYFAVFFEDPDGLKLEVMTDAPAL